MSNLSVLLPVAATSDTDGLRRAHRSVTEQTSPPDEIVLVTNQPLTDDVETAINNIVAMNSNSRHEHIPGARGLGGVLESGLEKCSKPFVARMDADDIAKPERFADQLVVLRETGADIVGSHLAEFRDDPERPERIRKVPVTHDEIAGWMPWRCPMNHPTVMFDREAVLDVGGYRTFPMMEDWDLWARCLAAGLRFRNLDRVLVHAKICGLNDRRGGLDYVRAEVRMAQELRKLGISSRRDMIRHLSLRGPPRLLPPKLRERVYQRFAR
ncbi:glycosyl transferase family 2 (plasmid) [Salinigranum rubrum]|uniref:Glycosyl transferase family 2 n=1 Tax=Salinigranum rubrum TaxID=755307 RepID=A0A2I8VQF0_9EURY|nr:glycosyl transferase family 2 [Salinigranum rubrum]